MNNTTNGIASVLKRIGFVVFVAAGIAILALIQDDDNWSLGVYIGIAGFISGMMFIGFGEIIELLTQSVQKQTAILDLLKQEKWEGTVEKPQMQSISMDQSCHSVMLRIGQNQLLSITTREDDSFSSEFDENIADVSWGDWQGDTTILSIRGIAPGKTDVYITGQNSGKKICIQVTVS